MAKLSVDQGRAAGSGPRLRPNAVAIVKIRTVTRVRGFSLWVAALAAGAWVLGFGAPGSALAMQPSAGCAQTATPGRFTATVQSGGFVRTALVNVPPGTPAAVPLPVVLVFHGASSNARAIEALTGMSWLGNRVGYITVYPNANGQHWKLNTRDGAHNKDVVFVRGLLDQLDQAVCIDDTRIYAAGSSNGASFVGRLGCWLSDRLAGIAPVAGDDIPARECEPARPVSVLEIHGTEDRSVPYRGRAGVGSVGAFLGWWAAADRCPGTRDPWREVARQAHFTAFTNCDAGTSVGHIRLAGEHHAWPSTRGARTGHAVGVPFSARRAIWQFFSSGTIPSDGLRLARRGRRR
jgi:polyhydroxybutyrate depolymerase